jgi:hypothetical protein
MHTENSAAPQRKLRATWESLEALMTTPVRLT